MKSNDMTELTDNFLRMRASEKEANLDHGIARERDTILRVCKEHEPPQAPDLAESKVRVTQLEKLLSDANHRHFKDFGTLSFSRAAQASLQAMGKLSEQLDVARSRVSSLETAQADRAARGLGDAA